VLTGDALYFFEKEEHVASAEWKVFIRLTDLKKITRVEEKDNKRKCIHIVSTTGYRP